MEWWNNKKNINKISKDKGIKTSDYYITSNKEEITSYLNFYYSNISNKKLLKITINTKVYGILGVDFDIIISSYYNNSWNDKLINKKDGKKQYDGTTSFKIDVSKEDFNNEVYVIVMGDDNSIIINNVTFEFKEYFPCFDYGSYKDSILQDIN